MLLLSKTLGAQKWRKIRPAQTRPQPLPKRHRIEDCGGLEILTQACQALDRAEGLRGEIERVGEVLRLGDTIKYHPALKPELANRAFIVRTLVRLGLNFEPVRAAVGRPGYGGIGLRS